MRSLFDLQKRYPKKCGPAMVLPFRDGTTGDQPITSPFVLGHEFGGVVVSGDLAGTRVAVDPTVSCDTCEYCLRGDPNLCPDHYFAGQAPHDGALREYMAWPLKALVPIPDTITDEGAAVLEPLGVAIHTVDLGKIKPGMTVRGKTLFRIMTQSLRERIGSGHSSLRGSGTAISDARELIQTRGLERF